MQQYGTGRGGIVHKCVFARQTRLFSAIFGCKSIENLGAFLHPLLSEIFWNQKNRPYVLKKRLSKKRKTSNLRG